MTLCNGHCEAGVVFDERDCVLIFGGWRSQETQEMTRECERIDVLGYQNEEMPSMNAARGIFNPCLYNGLASAEAAISL